MALFLSTLAKAVQQKRHIILRIPFAKKAVELSKLLNKLQSMTHQWLWLKTWLLFQYTVILGPFVPYAGQLKETPLHTTTNRVNNINPKYYIMAQYFCYDPE